MTSNLDRHVAAPQKRDIDRTRKRIRVRYGVDKADRTGFTQNVSETGLFVKTNNVFKPGSTIQVEMEFPERKFGMWARVIWAKKVPPQLAHILDCGMGVCFIDPGTDWVEFYMGWKRSSTHRPKH